MFGNHDIATATRIAAEKSAELGKHCFVVEALDADGNRLPELFTVAVPVKAMSGPEFINNLRNRTKGL